MMNEELATFFEQLAARGPAQRFLRGMGLDSRQFVLFLRLFRTLSERQELMGIIGVSRFNVSFLALCAIGIGVLPSPMAQESHVHILPHLMGLLTLALCFNLSFTDFHGGSWLFLTTPIATMRAFARGVFLALWVWAVGLPHLVILPFLVRFWGWGEAALFTGFSFVVLTSYLGFELGFISGLPFSNPVNESRLAFNIIYIQICWLAGLIFPTMLQSFLFRIWWVALLAGIVLVFLTWRMARWRLGDLEEEMRWRLHSLKMGWNLMFREIE
jgi:hypothetical protein